MFPVGSGLIHSTCGQQEQTGSVDSSEFSGCRHQPWLFYGCKHQIKDIKLKLLTMFTLAALLASPAKTDNKELYQEIKSLDKLISTQK